MFHSEHKFMTFKLALGSCLDTCIITNVNSAALKKFRHIYVYRSVCRGILRQIKGLLYLVWGAEDGYFGDLQGNCQENYQF